MLIAAKPAIAAFTLLMSLLLFACGAAKKQKMPTGFNYIYFRDSIKYRTSKMNYDTINIFDSQRFIPGVDSLDTFLLQLDTLWTINLTQLKHTGEQQAYQSDQQIITRNKQSIADFLIKETWPNQSGCREAECLLYAEVIKSKQILYLYLEGKLVDSFAVSTGIKGRETPSFSVRPSGPIFIKYSSRKFPGGNYQGLGKMPYAVFIKGGYAIHGTTPGNFRKLGSRASHGCIRLHPENAKIFYELIQKIGLEHTWVTIKEA